MSEVGEPVIALQCPTSDLRCLISDLRPSPGAKRISNSDQERWDGRWAEPKIDHVRQPHSLLVRFVMQQHLSSGHALDVACGVGQNAIWLAQHGFAVDAVDISPVALERGRASAASLGVTVNFAQADLDTWAPPVEAYHLVIGFRYLSRPLWPRLRTALRPGGWLVYQTFNLRKARPDADFPRENLLEPGELARVFFDWEILESGDDGGSSGEQSWIICRKPIDRKP